MYIPAHFKIKEEAIAFDIMKEHSFATLFSQHNGMPFATHLPLILNKDNSYLYGHFARPNPQWKDIVFGISMDYEVFLISRIKEEFDRSGDNNKSTAIGLQKTGTLISSGH